MKKISFVPHRWPEVVRSLLARGIPARLLDLLDRQFYLQPIPVTSKRRSNHEYRINQKS